MCGTHCKREPAIVLHFFDKHAFLSILIDVTKKDNIEVGHFMESTGKFIQERVAVLDRCISRDDPDPTIVNKSIKGKDPSPVVPFTHKLNGSFVDGNMFSYKERCSRYQLIHMEGSLLLPLHFNLRKGTMEEIIAIFLKDSSNGGNLLFTNSDFLDGKHIAFSGSSLLYMRKERICIPSSQCDGTKTIVMCCNGGKIKGIFPGLWLQVPRIRVAKVKCATLHVVGAIMEMKKEADQRLT